MISKKVSIILTIILTIIGIFLGGIVGRIFNVNMRICMICGAAIGFIAGIIIEKFTKSKKK